jgi:hypothetical protein
MEIAYDWQKAIVWLATGGYDKYGQHNIAPTPIEVWVRELADFQETVDKDGNNITLPGSAQVEMPVPIGSWFWFGTLSQWLGTGSAFSDEQIMYVKSFDPMKDIKGRNIFRKVMLMRLHGKGEN